MVDGPYRERPPEEDRSILVVTLNGHVIGVDRQTGAIRWKQGPFWSARGLPRDVPRTRGRLEL